MVFGRSRKRRICLPEILTAAMPGLGLRPEHGPAKGHSNGPEKRQKPRLYTRNGFRTANALMEHY